MKVVSKALATVQDSPGVDFGPNGGFIAVLSTPSLDRDGDRLLREDWVEPLPARVPLDIDHGMSVADTVGSFEPYFDGDALMMRAYFASTEKAQDVRKLVDEGHVRTVSVAFLNDKSLKDAKSPHRELLNAGIVAVPSNRDAVILASKAAGALKDALEADPEGDWVAELTKSVAEALGVKSVNDDLDEDEDVESKSASSDEEDDEDDGTFGDENAADSKSPKPYGNVTYADPKNGKYPIDTEEHIRAAWSYIHQDKNRSAYSSSELSAIEGRIRSAAEKHGIHVEASKGVYVNIIPKIDPEVWSKAIADGLKAAGGEMALISAIHDASVHLGAQCVVPEPDPDPGADDGANKSTEGEHKELTFEEFKSTVSQDDDPAPAPDETSAAAAADSDVEARAKAMTMRLTLPQSL